MKVEASLDLDLKIFVLTEKRVQSLLQNLSDLIGGGSLFIQQLNLSFELKNLKICFGRLKCVIESVGSREKNIREKK